MSINPNARRSQMAPVGRAVRAYVAPVERPSGATSPFDPAAQGQFDLESPPSPWLDLGWVENFQRTAATEYDTLRSVPAAVSPSSIARSPRREWTSICLRGASCKWQSPVAPSR